MKLTILHLGYCDVDKGRLLTPGVDDGKRVLIPIPAYLVETGDRRVLIDTGMHPVHVAEPDATFGGRPELAEILRPVMTAEDTLEHRLGELGLRLDDVTDVVNSHLHFDHCGQNDAFVGGPPVHVQRAHYEAALVGAAFPNRYFDIEGIDYRFVDGEGELFPGLRTILSPGHAPHHMSFLLDLPETGKLLLAIDAIFTRDNLEHDTWSSQADPATARESAERLARLAEAEGATVVYGHDPGQWETLRHAPESYA